MNYFVDLSKGDSHIKNLEEDIKIKQEKLNNILISNISFNNRNKIISEIQQAIDDEKEELENYKKSLERKKQYDKLFDIFLTNDIICELQKDLGPIEERYLQAIEQRTRQELYAEFARIKEENNLSIIYVEDLEEEQFKEILNNIKDYLLVDFLRVIKNLREEASRNNLRLDDSVPDENTWIGKVFKETLVNLFKGE
jgi:hypothetical protein